MSFDSRAASFGNLNGIQWSLIAAGILAAMVAGGLTLLAFGFDSGLPALLVGIVCATLPVPLYAALLLTVDRFEPEPPWMLAAAFLWGALPSAFIALMVNVTVQVIAGEAASSIYSAPIVEELMKSVILFFFFFWRKSGFDGIVDGFVYAGMVALGFAMTENISYYSREVGSDGHLGTILVIRGVLSPFAHPMFTSMTGVALGIARESRRTAVKVFVPLFGLGLAMALHFAWNASHVLGGNTVMLLVYIFLMVPIFLSVIGLALFASVREGRMIRRNLETELLNGVLSKSDADALGSIPGRMAATVRSLSIAGIAGWRARRKFHEAASLLAIHRQRLARGHLDCDLNACVREQDLIALLVERKQALRG